MKKIELKMKKKEKLFKNQNPFNKSKKMELKN